MKLVKHSEIVWSIEDFITSKECEDLLLLSETRGFEEAKVNFKEGARMMKELRNNYRLMYKDEALAEKFWHILKDFCPEEIESNVAIGLNEQFRFYKYESEQRFKRHIDGRFRRDENEESRITFMVYLNDDFAGGETRFDQFSISPKTGTALCFIHEQKHEGCPVSDGIKYVLRSDVMYRKVAL